MRAKFLAETCRMRGTAERLKRPRSHRCNFETVDKCFVKSTALSGLRMRLHI